MISDERALCSVLGLLQEGEVLVAGFFETFLGGYIVQKGISDQEAEKYFLEKNPQFKHPEDLTVLVLESGCNIRKILEATTTVAA